MNAPLIIGGYGTFGSHVARELARWGVPLVIAGRDRERAEAFAQGLGASHAGAAIDVTCSDSCRTLLEGRPIVVNCAGPFGGLGSVLLEACLAEGCHYVDIGDDRRYAGLVRSYHERFQQKDRAAVYGCSSLPGISGALALLACKQAPDMPERARVTLFIGNNNPKGKAAVHSLLSGLGQPFAAPQGTLHGFRDREVVPLPAPFGDRGVFNFESPEYDLFPSLLGVRAVSVKVGFELRLAAYSFAALALTGCQFGRRTAQLLEMPAKCLAWIGTSGGAVMTELFYAQGRTRRAALVGAHQAQRMAALPAALVTKALLEAPLSRPGASTAYELLGANCLLKRLGEEGFDIHTA